MIKRFSNGVEYHTFPLLDKCPELRHGVLTRRGPSGRDWTLAYDEKNPAPPSEIAANILAASRALGLPEASFVGQAHGAEILWLDDHPGYAPRCPSEIKAGYDALVSKPGRSLMIRLADCQGLLVYDPGSRVLALVHNGWRGSVRNIAGRVVAAMAERYELDPGGFLAALSPSLGPCCAEFKGYRTELPEEFWAHKDSRNYFDFPAVTRGQLLSAGLQNEHIELSGVCTKCSPDFFSHRRQETGRFAVLAGVV
ncbi:MAG: polyphenol oxidase family protein [Deltaproteobacteria bacterium]|jgi:YfiH family protein|nr:polyphenol oxidase family protein [Deltaproteobacteria bacterium]